MSFLDVSEQARNQILGSLDWASTFGNQLNENFVDQAEIPEALSRTRLNDANNRFNLSERVQNWNNDLQASGAEAQWNNWSNQYRNSQFDDITQLETLQRDSELMQTRANIDNFEQTQKLQSLQNEQAILETEEAMDKVTFDRMYDQLTASIPDYYSLPPSQRYEAAIDAANERNVPDRVKARIRRNYIESSQEDLENLRKLSSAKQQLTQMENTIRELTSRGVNVPSSMITAYSNIQNDIIGYQSSIRDLEGSIRVGQDLGVLNARQAGEILGRPVDVNVDPATQFLQSVPVVATNQPENAPAVTQPTPVPQQTTQQPAQPTGGIDMETWNRLATSLPPCATEDSVNCVWRADVQGNGTGRSFIAIGDQNNPTIIPIPDAQAVMSETGTPITQSTPVPGLAQARNEQTLIDAVGPEAAQQIQQEAEVITPPVAQAGEFQTTYQQPNIISRAVQSGYIQNTIESDPTFPAELRGVLTKNSYMRSEIPSELQKLRRIVELVETMTDPTNKRIMEDILTAKATSIVNLLQNNGV